MSSTSIAMPVDSMHGLAFQATLLPSMAILPMTLLACAFYMAGGSYTWLVLYRRLPPRPRLVQTLGLMAILIHGIVLYAELHGHLGLNLGFFQAASLINWLICTFLLLASLRMPLLNLSAGLFPLATLAILTALFSSRHYVVPDIPKGLMVHILTSLVAYSLFTVAMVQSLLLWCQQSQLKRRRTAGLIQVLPPLQTMERLLFDLLLAGMLFLTVSLITGFIFVDNIFAQHLAHKTVLSILSWLTFGVLLVGHYRFGWRGLTAVRWTLGGSIMLILAYFGTKFVLQMVLGET